MKAGQPREGKASLTTLLGSTEEFPGKSEIPALLLTQ